MVSPEIAMVRHKVYQQASIDEEHLPQGTLHHDGLYYVHTRSPHRSRIPTIPFYWQSEK